MEREGPEGFRLAPQQERLWSLGWSEAGTSFWAQCVVELAGQLEADTLRKALGGVVARQEILRTAFQTLQGLTMPVQIVRAGADPLFEERGPVGIESDEDLTRALRESPLDLSLGSPLRVWLVRGDGDPDRLCLTLPALCADELGLDNLLREIGAAYAAALHSTSLPKLPVQFADLAAWQHEILDLEDSRGGLDHWRRTAAWLAGVTVRLPFEAPPRPGARFTPLRRSLFVPAGVAAEIDRRARARGTVSETFYLAGWQVLLSRLAGEPRLPLALRCEGRRWEELAESVGPFARYLPIRAEVEPALPFAGVWAAAIRAAREAEDWQESFEAGRAASGGIEFRMPAFGFDGGELGTCSLGGVHGTVVMRRAWIEAFAMRLSCLRRGDGVETVLEYDAARFTGEDAACVLRSLHTLLREAAERPESLAGDLPLVEAGEVRALWAALAGPAVERPDVCLHELFARRAAESPETIACISGEEQITYAELDLRSNRMARLLQRLGIGPERLVGVCSDRSTDMVVALLGVLKAGGAYVPIDPSYPLEHRRHLLADAVPQVIVVQDGMVERLGPHAAPSLLRLGSDAPALAAQEESLPESGARPDNLAYVIYTSGSTGRPKGVMITHRAILNRLLWMQSEHGLGAGDRVLFKTQLAFDASVWEIFATLLAGATVVVARPGGHQDSAYLVHEIHDRQVTVLQLVPSMLRVWLREPGLESCGSLRRVFSGGEALPAELARRLRSRLSAGLVNLYGPTEVSIDSSFRVCRDDEGDEIVPIGRSLPNLRLYILDGRGHAVPRGGAGELCVGGVGLARGYLGRPDLTAERFVPDPSGGTSTSEKGARLYRTGDLARMGADVDLEFLGRVDDQVKIRGFRVEPREVEAVLAKHFAVVETVVLAREDTPGDRRLVAYVVTGRPAPEISELRRFLEERLPEHLIPSALVLLDILPLTPNGKLDRKALPPPGRGEAAAGELAAPRDPVEATLALLWSEVLGVAAVGAHDSFFELGGHSLLATQVISRVRQAFGVELPLRSLFEAPTPATLARRVEEARRGAAAVPPPIAAVPRDGRIPLSFAQQRLWFIDQLVRGITAYHLPMALRFRGSLCIPALDRALGEIVRRHDSLRTTFAEVDGTVVQRVEEGDPLPLPFADLSGLPEAAREPEARRLVSELIDSPFDLSRGPLLRSHLLRLGELDHLGVLVVHHIVSDGWSTGILLREMTALYEAFEAGQPSPLPRMPIQYADFAAWQRQWLQGSVLESQLDYWRSHLAGLPVLTLPTDRMRPAIQSFRGRSERLAAPPAVMERHGAFSRPRGITTYMTLLAAFSVLLHRLTEQREIVVGSPIANRNRLETEGLIGFFVNALVLRTDVGGNPTFAALQERIREVALSAAIYQDLPFEKLVEALQPERDLSRSPLFQVVLALQNAPAGRLELRQVSIAKEPFETASAKFDLTFDLMEAKDGGIEGALEYNTDLFDTTTMIRLACSFQAILRAAADAPERPILDLHHGSEAERHQVTAEWNDTRSFSLGDGSIVSLVEARVRLSPGAPAVVADEGALTYAEMNARANRLAHHLLALGLERGGLVAVLLDRTLDMVPSLLGILKAGGAYVPLDPMFPAERIRWILTTLGVQFLVTQSGRLQTAADALADLPRLSEIVCVDAGGAANAGAASPVGGARVWTAASLAARPEDDTPPRSGPEDLAYIIFTSGSTGTPKGVMVPHRPVVNLIDWVNRTFDVQPTDRVLFITSLCFDLSVYDIFGLLAAGGVVRVVSDRDAHEPEALVRLLCREPITFWDSAPAALQQLAPFLPAEPVEARLRLVFLSGDWIPVALPNRVRATFPRARLVALGGATEATVWSNSFPIGRVEPQWPSIPYGRPIPNARYHVLDAGGLPHPIGIPGDLCIGGECLAAGYAADPGQTAEKFIPDPFSASPGGRLYRTGDRARFLADGNLEFLGRLDHQVKIRGFRIELGEIEAVLARHPAVREAAVLAREERPGDKRLVAYLAVCDGMAVEATELREHLRHRLPEYMVPAAWVFLPALPVTANGKLDRRSLPAPDRPEVREVESQPPRTATEQSLAALWQEVLGAPLIGRGDNFFELGGHSLLATQLSSRIRGVFSVPMPLRELFVAPTLAAMAARIEELLLASSQGKDLSGLLDLLETLDEEAAAEMLRFDELPEEIVGGV
jgi:amino acid adenylation domain-containing protein